MRNKGKIILLLLFYGVIVIGFSVYFAYGWNYLLSVDNAEHLAVNFSPWWQQIRYWLYVLLSVVPTGIIYLALGKNFTGGIISSRLRRYFILSVFLVIFSSGIIGTALGTLELQHDTRIEIIKYKEQLKRNQLLALKRDEQCDGATAYENLDY